MGEALVVPFLEGLAKTAREGMEFCSCQCRYAAHELIQGDALHPFKEEELPTGPTVEHLKKPREMPLVSRQSVSLSGEHVLFARLPSEISKVVGRLFVDAQRFEA